MDGRANVGGERCDASQVDEVLIGRAEARATGMDIHRIKSLIGAYRGSLDQADVFLRIAAKARGELEQIASRLRE